MKILNMVNIYKRVCRCSGFLLISALAVFLLGSCKSQDETDDPAEGDLLQKIIPAIDFGENFAEAKNYEAFFYLFNESSSECFKFQSAERFDALQPFVVEQAAYTLLTLMVEPEHTLNVSFEASRKATYRDSITVVDLNKEIPDMVLGTAVLKKLAGSAVPVADIKRLVGGFHVKLKGVSNDVTKIELTVKDLYNQICFTGEYGFSKKNGTSKTFELKKNGSVFENTVTIMPSDVTQEVVKMVFRVYKGTEYEDFFVRMSDKLLSDNVASLEGDAEAILKNTLLSGVLTYAPWDQMSEIGDNITVDDLKKTWSSNSLPIGGSATPYNNFYASSSLNDDWSKLYDSYLYDGIKDEEHKDLYWGPDYARELADGTIPCWYIDLGSPKEGLTIVYWNKFGGAGGQKVRKIVIYGSNENSDYEAGNTAWVKIGEFISDKTKPGVNGGPDAGAKVNSGKIEFNKGNSSYRYVKCEFTSRVSNTGEIIDDSNVNVAEVEITTWTCK